MGSREESCAGVRGMREGETAGIGGEEEKEERREKAESAGGKRPEKESKDEPLVVASSRASRCSQPRHRSGSRPECCKAPHCVIAPPRQYSLPKIRKKEGQEREERTLPHLSPPFAPIHLTKATRDPEAG
jgi:hypothetical protein